MLFLQGEQWEGNLLIKYVNQKKKFKQQCKLTGPIPKLSTET